MFCPRLLTFGVDGQFKKNTAIVLSTLIRFWVRRPIQKVSTLVVLSTLIEFCVRRPIAEFPRLFFCPLLLGWTIGGVLRIHAYSFCPRLRSERTIFVNLRGLRSAKRPLFHNSTLILLSTVIVFVHAYCFWVRRPISEFPRLFFGHAY